MAERTASGLNVATCELLAGIVEIGMQAGLQFVVSVYDARMARILKSAGCPAELVGEPKRIGDVMTYAGLFDISESALANIRAASGIETSVLQGPLLMTKAA
jgi:acyl homoserine lactone synthase